VTFPKIELHVHLEGTARAGKLPQLVAAGVACSVSTDDPAMFGTDLTADYAAAIHLGISARDCYLAGPRGALCDQQTKNQLQQAGVTFDWAGLTAAG